MQSASPAGKFVYADRILGFQAGPPYAGKSRTNSHATEMSGVEFFDMSEALRRCSQAAEAQQFMAAGDVVPFNIVHKALTEWAERMAEGKKAICSGFPRDRTQADFAISLQLKIAFLDTDLEVCARRAQESLELARSGAPENDRGSRSDDSDPAIIRKRFGIYVVDTLPALWKCEREGLVARVDGALEPVERATQLCRIFGLATS